MTTERTPCASAAAAAGDPLAGNAPPARHWFLIEHPGPWGRDAIRQSNLDPDLSQALGSWVAGRRGRVALMRRPGRRQRHGGVRHWFLVDSRPGRECVRGGTFDDERELLAVLDGDGAGEPHADPLQLVCTHGRHDQCCAVLGRPLARAASLADPDGTWECSHIGGCRFAPALVLLPHGYVFGQLPEDAVASVIRDYREGRLDPTHVRGRSALAPVEQAAELRARAATNCELLNACRLVESTTADGLTRVRFTDPDHVVVLREQRTTVDRPLTCAARNPGVLRRFEPVDQVSRCAPLVRP